MAWWEHTSEPPRLVCVPSMDTAFADAVQTVYAMDPSIDSADGLEEALRPFFASSRVRERQLDGERPPTWYVYRDAP